MANKGLDDTLTPDDAVEVLEELLPAQNESYALGLKFKLPQSEVQAIHDTNSKPRDRLLQILIEFFKQTDPKPSWRVIVEALRSRAVNQSALAAKVESAGPHHLEAAVETGQQSMEVRSHRPGSSSMAVRYQVLVFRQRFNVIKEKAIQRLIACQVTVASMVFWLTSIRALGEHKLFLEENLEALGMYPHHWMLFAKLNLYWNYLAYDLLHQLLEVLTTHFGEFRTISKDMAVYKKDLEKFKRNTPLKLFCRADFSEQDTPPPGFQEMVGEFNWSENVTLEEVEQFRKRYAREYNLENCAMMVNSIRPGSFVVTWFVPVSIIQILSQETDRALNLFVEFEVTRLEIAGNCVYHSSFQKVAPSLPSFTNDTSTERTELPSQNSAESQKIELYNEHIAINELIRTREEQAVEELYKKHLLPKINVDFQSGVLYHNCSSHCNEYVKLWSDGATIYNNIAYIAYIAT